MAVLMLLSAVPFMGVTAAAANHEHNYIYAQGKIGISKISNKYVFTKETYKCADCNVTKAEDSGLQNSYNGAVSDALKIINSDAYKLDTAKYRAVNSAYEALIGLTGSEHYGRFIQEKIAAVNAAVSAFNAASGGTDLLKEFTVTFVFKNAEGEKATAEKKVIYSSAATAPVIGENGFARKYFDENNHYDLVFNKNGTIKWDKDFSKVTSDMTVTASYTATKHNYGSVVSAAKAPTCTEKGSTESRKCKDCDYVSGGKEIAALGHSWGTPVSNGAWLKPKQISKCTRTGCNAEYAEHVKASDHSIKKIAAKAATCTAAGHEAYEYCLYCNWSTEKVIPALGHDIVKDSAKDATCYAEGLTEGKHCTRCKDASVTVAQKKIPALNHDYSLEIMDSKHLATVATCEKAATYFKTCSLCGQIGYNESTFAGEALGHSYNKTTVKDLTASAATCTEPAKKYYTCSRCDKSAAYATDKEDHTYTVGAALGHKWPTDSKGKEVWTALNANVEKRTCTRSGCGYTEALCKADSDGRRRHTLVTVSEQLATCNTAGHSQYRECSVNGCKYTEDYTEYPAAHTLSRTETSVTLLPTCINEGTSESVVYCTAKNCSYKDAKTTTVAALGHDYTAFLDDGNGTTHTKTCKRADCSAAVKDHFVTENHNIKDIAEKKATCVEDGNTAGKGCDVCGYTNVTIIKAAGKHDEEVIPGKAATCTEKGLTEGKKCKVCGEVTVKQEEIPATGHKEETIPGTPATCTEAGKSDGKKCSVCGAVLEEQKDVPALGHDWEEIAAKEPTCTEKGMTAGKKCKRCGTVDSEAKEIEALGHDMVTDTEEVPATCLVDGHTKGEHCSRCDYKVESQVIKAVGQHTEEVIPAKAATCTEDGNKEGKKCSVCGEVLVEAEVIKALGHEYEIVTKKATTANDGSVVKTCTVCGATESTPIAKVATIVLTKSKLTYNGKAQTPAVVVKDSTGNVFVKDTDYSVTYSNNVKAGKATVTVKFINENYDVTKVLSFTIVPTATAKVAVSSAARVLNVSWSAVTGATGYRVQVFNGSKCVRDRFTTKTNWKFTKLSKGTKYKVVVTAYVTVGETNVYGAAKALNTSTSPAMPNGVKVAAGKKSVSVKWNAVAGATGYTVYYKQGKNGKFKTVTVSAKKNKVAIKKLASGKTYFVKVTANKRVGNNVARSLPSKLQNVTVK